MNPLARPRSVSASPWKRRHVFLLMPPCVLVLLNFGCIQILMHTDILANLDLPGRDPMLYFLLAPGAAGMLLGLPGLVMLLIREEELGTRACFGVALFILSSLLAALVLMALSALLKVANYFLAASPLHNDQVFESTNSFLAIGLVLAVLSFQVFSTWGKRLKASGSQA